ncbi:MAG: rSAM-associated Gly-rich repeat protein [Proteobacteria bacterium]|nr:rSAM-associated Gly-rich repeat protein [Pseudomonadota bacterium]
MSSKQKLSKALAAVLPAGAVGASVLLALAPAQAATVSSVSAADTPPVPQSVAERLAAIQGGVSDALAAAPDDTSFAADGDFIPTWWGNGGWGRFGIGWGNGGWHNWGNGWHNWGNGWHNWGNGGWNNWSNGWHNFWHNA